MPEEVNTPSCCVHSCFPEWRVTVLRWWASQLCHHFSCSEFTPTWGGGGMQIRRLCQKYIILPFCREMIIRHLWTKETVHLMLWLKQCYKRPAEGPVELRVTAYVMQHDCYSRPAKKSKHYKTGELWERSSLPDYRWFISTDEHGQESN